MSKPDLPQNCGVDINAKAEAATDIYNHLLFLLDYAREYDLDMLAYLIEMALIESDGQGQYLEGREGDVP